jgi:predicted Zn-dependent protease
MPKSTSLFQQQKQAQDDRLITRETCEAVWKLVRSLARGGGRTAMRLTSHWNGEIRWARNRVYLASDRRNIVLSVIRTLGTSQEGRASINQLDEESIEFVVRKAEAEAARAHQNRPLDMKMDLPPEILPETKTWSDTTYGIAAAARGEVAAALSKEAEAHGFLAAGYMEVRGVTRAYAGMSDLAGTGAALNWREETYDPAIHDTLRYHRMTQAQCSMTIRHPKGLGSGWAGLSSYEWSKLDCAALAKTALDKCIASLNPIRIEPGRYTVILEPQAVASLVDQVMYGPMMSLFGVEVDGGGPWWLGHDNSLGVHLTKLGLKVIDERITISYDPNDPDFGVMPHPDLKPVIWFDKGVLANLSYPREYWKETRKEEGIGLFNPGAYRMSGGSVTMEEMISTTDRGLLVTRFSNITKLDNNSLLCTGLTRDGLWLIERGKITKAIHNMRFTESPLFVLNQVEQLGIPVPVFTPEQDWMKPRIRPVIVPPIKARDFSFTSTIDAV